MSIHKSEAVSLQVNIREGSEYRAEPTIKVEGETRYCQRLEINIDDFQLYLDFKVAASLVDAMSLALDRVAIDLEVQRRLESAKDDK